MLVELLWQRAEEAADLLRAQRDRAVAEAGWAEIVAADARRDQATLFDDLQSTRRDAWLLAMEVVRVLDLPDGPERAEAEKALRHEARVVFERHHGGKL